MSDLLPFGSGERQLASLAIGFDDLLKMGEFDVGQRIRRARAFLYIAPAISDETQILFPDGGDEYYLDSVKAMNAKLAKPEDVFIVRLRSTTPHGKPADDPFYVETLRSIVRTRLRQLGAPSDN